MKFQRNNNSSDNDRGRYENDIRNSVEFDYGALESNIRHETGELLWKCLRDGINQHLTKNLFELLRSFDALSEEERKALIARSQGMSFRKIGQLLGIDKLTAQNRWLSGIEKLKKLPALVDIRFEPEKYLRE